MKDWPLKNQVKPGYLQGVWHPGLRARQHSTNLTGVEERYLALLIMLTVQAAKLVLKLITFQLSICDCGVWPPTTVRAVIIIDI